jgi:hypothetical protein
MGFASLGVLESVVRATIGLRWEDVGELSDILALVDADISQAIQVSGETRHTLYFENLHDGFRALRKRSTRVALEILQVHVR